jgi:hypothetical protein
MSKGIDIKLEKPSAPISVGDQLDVIVELSSDRTLEIRGLGVELASEARYKGQSSDTHSGNVNETRFHEVEHPIGTTTVCSGENRTAVASFRVPIDAAPSYKGKLIEIAWRLTAKADIPRTRDTEKTVEVCVRGIPNRGPFDEEMPRSGSACQVLLGLPSYWYREGDQINGEISLLPNADVAVSHVDLDLISVERVYRGLSVRASTQLERRVRLDEPRKLSGGTKAVLPFAISIPFYGRPFVSTEQAIAFRQLKAKVALKGATDCMSAVPILTY